MDVTFINDEKIKKINDELRKQGTQGIRFNSNDVYVGISNIYEPPCQSLYVANQLNTIASYVLPCRLWRLDLIPSLEYNQHWNWEEAELIREAVTSTITSTIGERTTINPEEIEKINDGLRTRGTRGVRFNSNDVYVGISKIYKPCQSLYVANQLDTIASYVLTCRLWLWHIPNPAEYYKRWNLEEVRNVLSHVQAVVESVISQNNGK